MRNGLGAGVLASAALHLLVGIALLIDMPVTLPQPETEETVAVELVPPPLPVPPAPEEKAEEEPPAVPETPPPPPEETEMEAPTPQEQQTEPPADATEAEEEPAPAPPPPPTDPQEPGAETADAEPPPPPPAEEAEEQAEEQPEAEAEAPPPPGGEAPQEQAETEGGAQGEDGQPLPVLRPVFEFGEKDRGPRLSEDGNASSDAAAGEEAPPETTEELAGLPEGPSPSEETIETAEEAADMPLTNDSEEAAAGALVPEDVEAPKVDFGGAPTEGPGGEGTEDDGKAGILAIPQPKPDPAVELAMNLPRLPEAKRLFSQSEGGDVVATTAMAGMPRDLRAGQLCATELREQLVRGSPAFRPEMLPSYKLPRGTVMDARKAAFRADGQWYELQFRCEVNEEVTKVVSFAYEVGAPVPRSEWTARRFPAF